MRDPGRVGGGFAPRVASRKARLSSSSDCVVTLPPEGCFEYIDALSEAEEYRLKILISNDDGYRARGILALREALTGLADLTVMAPDRNKSGASNSLTLDVPVRVGKVEPGVYFVTGTPTDCVHLAISGFFDFEHDMVVSGNQRRRESWR